MHAEHELLLQNSLRLMKSVRTGKLTPQDREACGTPETLLLPDMDRRCRRICLACCGYIHGGKMKKPVVCRAGNWKTILMSAMHQMVWLSVSGKLDEARRVKDEMITMQAEKEKPYLDALGTDYKRGSAIELAACYLAIDALDRFADGKEWRKQMRNAEKTNGHVYNVSFSIALELMHAVMLELEIRNNDKAKSKQVLTQAVT